MSVRRADRFLVELFGVENAPLDPRDLRRNERGAVLKRRRRVLGPYLELLVMSRQSLEVF